MLNIKKLPKLILTSTLLALASLSAVHSLRAAELGDLDGPQTPSTSPSSAPQANAPEANAPVAATTLLHTQVDAPTRLDFLHELEDSGLTEADLENIEFEFAERTRTLTVINKSEQTYTHQQLFFLGSRLGVLVPFGITGTMIHTQDGKRIYNIQAAITTSYDEHTIEAGAGWHPWGKAFYVGARVKAITMFDPTEPGGYGNAFVGENTENFVGLEPQIGWAMLFGKKQRILGTVSLGATKAWGSNYNLPAMADIDLGIAIRIGR